MPLKTSGVCYLQGCYSSSGVSTVLAQRDTSLRQKFLSTLIAHLFIAKMTSLSHTVNHTELEDWLLVQPLLHFPIWKPLLSSASAEFSVDAWHVSFPNRKKPTHVTVNCWFCNQDTVVPYGNRNCWDCPNCEQYNGFQEVLWGITGRVAAEVHALPNSACRKTLLLI